MALAMDVLPVPGGPHKTIEGNLSEFKEVLKIEFLLRRWYYSITSSITLGRIRPARGSGGGRRVFFFSR